MNRFLKHKKKFNEIGKKYDVEPCGKYYIYYLYDRLKYKNSIDDFFSNKLYDKSISHQEYYANLHTNIHKWSVVSKNFKSDASLMWRIIHRIDYTISKVMYPGLDAMDYFRYEFYKIRHCERKKFITEGELVKLNRKFNSGIEAKKAEVIVSDKREFNRLFSDIVKRKWIATDECTKEMFYSFCEGMDKIIAKPLDGGAGIGIFVADVTDKKKIDDLYEKIKDDNYILEEIIVQDNTIRRLNPSSVNTARVYSVHYHGNTYITGATLRIGSGEGPTDNYSRGGFAAEIDVNTGCVISKAVSQFGEGVYVHPKTGEQIIGIQIPYWNEIKKVVKRAHERVPSLGYLGWDVVVCADNSITFLEVNTCAGVELQQHPSKTGKKEIYLDILNDKVKHK